MHLAATHDKYLNVGLLQGSVKDEALVSNFGGGSTPADNNVPTLSAIRQKLSATLEPLKKFVSEQTPTSLTRQIAAPGGKTRQRRRVDYPAPLARSAPSGADSFDLEFVQGGARVK